MASVLSRTDGADELCAVIIGRKVDFRIRHVMQVALGDSDPQVVDVSEPH